MRIVFLCGGLQPGRDGVGDYIRRLAIELINLGNQVAAIALNDQSITEIISGVQSEGIVNLSVLRIPSILNEKKRFDYAKKFINSIDPDILSLQYVPFSFHHKGISLKLNAYLENIGKGMHWHIMFHELWVGMDKQASFKLVYWGKLQKWLIKSLVMKLKPIAIHTQTKLYQLQLAKIKVNANYLPLFSNIPIYNYDSSKIKDLVNNSPTKGAFVFVLFGGIHPGAPIQKFAGEAAEYAKKNNIQIILKLVGRCGTEQDNWVAQWKSAGLTVETFGEQSKQHISDILLNSSMGVTTTPVAIIEKSGTVAAMREHGLVVICIRSSWKARGFLKLTPPKGILEYQFGNLGECISNSTMSFDYPTLSEVGKKFSDDIQKAKMKLNN